MAHIFNSKFLEMNRCAVQLRKLEMREQGSSSEMVGDHDFKHFLQSIHNFVPSDSLQCEEVGICKVGKIVSNTNGTSEPTTETAIAVHMREDAHEKTTTMMTT